MTDDRDDSATFGSDTPMITEGTIAEKSGAEQVADSLGRSTAEHERTRNRTLWIVVGCTALGMTLAIGAITLSRGGAAQTEPASEVVPSNGVVTADARPAPSGSPTLATRASTDPASSAPAARPGGSGNQSAAPAPVTPSASRIPLPELSSLPAGTIAMVVVPKGFQGATYKVSFRPFGWGSGGAAGGRLVLVIDSSQPIDAGAKSLNQALAKRNLTVWCTSECSEQIDSSGSYSGVLEVRAQGDVGVFYLTQSAHK